MMASTMGSIYRAVYSANNQHSGNVDDEICDLGGGQCNHKSDAKAIFRLRSEDLPLSQSSHHHKDREKRVKFHDKLRKSRKNEKNLMDLCHRVFLWHYLKVSGHDLSVLHV